MGTSWVLILVRPAPAAATRAFLHLYTAATGTFTGRRRRRLAALTRFGLVLISPIQTSCVSGGAAIIVAEAPADPLEDPIAACRGALI